MSRVKWKGPFIFKKRNEFLPNECKSRDLEVSFSIIGKTYLVHNGKSLNEILLTEDMVGHKLGEFIPTRSKFEFKKKTKK